MLNLRNNKNINIRTGSPFNGIIPGNKVPCRAGVGKLVVQATGNVLPCEVFKHHRRCDWGLSVHKKTLQEILEASCLVKLRRSLANSNCLNCPIHKSLRERQKVGTAHEQIPGASVHA